MGIHSSELKQVFKPFCLRHMAEAMGERLSVISESGVGSTFTLPLRTADLQQAESALASSTMAQGDGE